MSDSTLGSPRNVPRIPTWAQKVIPIFVSLLILYYCFRGHDYQRIMEAAKRADLLLAILAIVIPQIIFWFFEALITERHMAWFHGPFDFWKYFWIRGSIYILQFVNNIFSVGGILIYLQRKTQMSWRKLLGIMLFRMGLTLWAIGLLMIPATLAIQYYGNAEDLNINMYVWWGILIFGVLWMSEAWVVWHKNKNFGLSKIVVRDRNTEFWTAFRLATRRQWLLTWAMGLIPLLLEFVGLYFVNLAFEIHVPFVQFMIVAPLAISFADLPIAFAAFGTTTAAWTYFFTGYGPLESLLAVSLFFPFVRLVCRAAIGLVSLRPAIKEISTLFQPENQEPESVAETIMEKGLLGEEE